MDLVIPLAISQSVDNSTLYELQQHKNDRNNNHLIMKRRVPKFSNKDALLPMTNADAEKSSRLRRPPGSKNNSGPSGLNLCGFMVCLSLVVCLIVFVIVTQSYHTQLEHNPLVNHPLHKKLHSKFKDLRNKVLNVQGKQPDPPAPRPKQFQRRDKEQAPEDLPLHEFTSLRYPLLNSKVVLLYFAASWCPMSTPVTNQLDSLFRPLLLPPLPPIPANADAGADSEKKNDNDNTPRSLQRHGASLVYVSSDRSADAMADYQKENWMAVPYDSADRNKLKQHFRTCAKVELEPLGMEDRDREIPALLILSGATHQVLSYDGVKEVHRLGDMAMDYWYELADREEEKNKETEAKDEE